MRDAARAHADAGDADPARWGISEDVETVRTWDSRTIRRTPTPHTGPRHDQACRAHFVLYPEAEHIDLWCAKPPHDTNQRHRDADTGAEWGDDD